MITLLAWSRLIVERQRRFRMAQRLLTRREAMFGIGAFGAACALGAGPFARIAAARPPVHPPPSPKLMGLLVDSHDDVRLLDEIERASFVFFGADGSESRKSSAIVASLPALATIPASSAHWRKRLRPHRHVHRCDAGLHDEDAARVRVRAASIYWTKLQHQHGFLLYHFVKFPHRRSLRPVQIRNFFHRYGSPHVRHLHLPPIFQRR